MKKSVLSETIICNIEKHIVKRMELKKTIIKESEKGVIISHEKNSLPDIFKLHAIACDDLFDFLSLSDLSSMGLTCERMNRLIGLYFQQNFHKTFIRSTKNGVSANGINVNHISRFIERIKFSSYTSEEFQFIEKNCRSVKYISFVGQIDLLTKSKISCLKNTLDKVENIELVLSSTDGEIYDCLLKYCTNLKSLRIHSKSGDNNWFLQSYPKLNSILINNCDEIPEFSTFLEKNSGILNMGFYSSFIFNNAEALLTSNIMIDKLTLHFCNTDGFDSFCFLLNKLYQRGFYKNLKLDFDYICDFNKEIAELLAKLPSVSKIDISFMKGNVELPIMKKLRKIKFKREIDSCGFFKSITVNACNIECATFLIPTFDKILYLMSNLKKLKEIRTHRPFTGILNIEVLNNAREKLKGAHKVIIYLFEMDYLTTKWSFGNKDFNMVEIRRNGSSYPSLI